MSWNSKFFPNQVLFGHQAACSSERFDEGPMLSRSLLDFPGFPLVYQPTLEIKYRHHERVDLSSEGTFRTRLFPALSREPPIILDPLLNQADSSESPSPIHDLSNNSVAMDSPRDFPPCSQVLALPSTGEAFEKKRPNQATSDLPSKITIEMLLNYDNDTDLPENFSKSKRLKRERRHTISTMADYSSTLPHQVCTTNSAISSPEPHASCFIKKTNDLPGLSGDSICPQDHLKSVESDSSPGNTITSQTEKAHLCKVTGCDMRFKRLEHLKRHHRIHTMERPFSCSYPGCGKTFSRQDNLRQHTRTHQRKNTRNKRHTRQRTL